MEFAYLFPGQGSQTVGMGAHLAEAFPEAKEVFEEVDDSLDMHLSKIMFDGPSDQLILTENAQPALMAVSIAVLRVLEKNGKNTSNSISCVAGHSLGEYSALVSAKSLNLRDAAKLLKIRGKSMQDAVPLGEGAMAAFLGVDYDQIQNILKKLSDDDLCEIANDNGAGQIVISGWKSIVEKAIFIAKDEGVRKSMILPVSAPFHCKLMAPAAEIMHEALLNIEIQKPLLPVISNVTATPYKDSVDIIKQLVEQVTNMVRWRETMNYMINKNIDNFIELGSGKVLAGLIKRISRDSKAISIQEPKDIDNFFSNF